MAYTKSHPPKVQTSHLPTTARACAETSTYTPGRVRAEHNVLTYLTLPYTTPASSRPSVPFEWLRSSGSVPLFHYSTQPRRPCLRLCSFAALRPAALGNTRAGRANEGAVIDWWRWTPRRRYPPARDRVGGVDGACGGATLPYRTGEERTRTRAACVCACDWVP